MALKLPRKRNLGIAKFIIQFRKLRGAEVHIYLAVSYKLFGFKKNNIFRQSISQSSLYRNHYSTYLPLKKKKEEEQSV